MKKERPMFLIVSSDSGDHSIIHVTESVIKETHKELIQIGLNLN